MDAKPRAVDHRVYEDFEPQMGWTREERFDTLIVLLPGFSKEQLKVQITASRNLRVRGERSLGNNKWRRFVKELAIPSDVETTAITAKFAGGTLYIIHPKAITLAKPQEQDAKLAEQHAAEQHAAEQLAAQLLAEEHAAAKSQENFKTETQVAQKISDQGHAAQKNGKPAAQATADTTRKTSKKEEPNDTTGKTSVPQNVPEKEKEPKSTAEKEPEKEEPIDSSKKKITAAKAKDVTKRDSEKEMNGWSEETKKVSDAGSDKKHETPPGDLVENHRKMDKGSIYRGKSAVENYNQVARGLILEVKKPKKLINFVVAALLAFVLLLYLKKVTKPLGGSKSQF